MAHQTVKYWALNNGLNSMHSVIKYAGMPNVNANPPPPPCQTSMKLLEERVKAVI